MIQTNFVVRNRRSISSRLAISVETVRISVMRRGGTRGAQADARRLSAGDRDTTTAYTDIHRLFQRGELTAHLQGYIGPARPDEYAGAGNAYSRSEGAGQRRPRLGEVGSRAFNPRA
jgi:hypothetical protein